MDTRPRRAALASLGLALVLGFFVFGSVLYRALIGLDPAAFPAGAVLQRVGEALFPGLSFTVAGLVLGLGPLVILLIAAFVWMRSAVRARVAAQDPGRRSFLTGAASGAGVALGTAVLGVASGLARAWFGIGNQGRGWGPIGSAIFAEATYTHPRPSDAWRGSRIQSHRRLGRTGWEVSDIVLGTGRIRGEDGERIARAALERGVNYFDTAPDYSGSGSEQAMGKALASVGRDRVFVATKFCTPTGHLPAGAAVSEYERVIEDSLRRLGTDYVDLVHIHSCDDVKRLMDPNVHEAFERLKRAGKARFIGFSTHTPRLEEVVETAVESGRFDVMMLAYHHGIWPGMKDLIHRARSEQDMGVVAMKTLKGAKHRGLEDFAPYADSYSQAALKWALSNTDVSCAVISFFEIQHVDEFLYASGKPFSSADATVLREYDRRVAGTYCAPHCGACLDSCPEGVAIHDVLRHRMYFEDYGWEKIAIEGYAKLERNASPCVGCAAPCLGSCPLGVPIPERTAEAHRLLTLA